MAVYHRDTVCTVNLKALRGGGRGGDGLLGEKEERGKRILCREMAVLSHRACEEEQMRGMN